MMADTSRSICLRSPPIPYILIFIVGGLSFLFLARGDTNYTTIGHHPSTPASFPTTLSVDAAAAAASNDSGVEAGAVTPSFRRDGDFLLGGLFDLHVSQNGQCSDFNPRGLQWMHAMVYAIERINDRADILPNITIGFDIYDTCADPNIALRNSVNFIGTEQSSDCAGSVTEKKIEAVVGPATSSEAVFVASLFNLFKLPQVSYAATSDTLSESRYTYFVRPIPNDTFQARAMAHLASYFDFQTVAVLANDDGAYGVSGTLVFEDEAAKRNICVAYRNVFGGDASDEEFADIVQDLGRLPEVRVIVGFAGEAAMIQLLTYFADHNITGYLWIASDGWGASNIVEDPKLARVVNGMLGVYHHAEIIPEFDEYIFGLSPQSVDYQDPFLNEFWQDFFRCQLSAADTSHEDVDMYDTKCSGAESINASYAFTNASLVSSIFDSVEVVARAMHEYLCCDEGECLLDLADVTGDVLITHMKNVNFSGNSGYRIRPDPDGNLAEVAWFDFYNLQPVELCSENFKLQKVGDWRDDVGEVFIADVEQLYWPMYNTCSWFSSPPSSVCGEKCNPGTRRVTLDITSCCWQCVKCSANHFSNESDATSCTACGDDQISNDNRTYCIDLPYKYTSPISNIGIAVLSVAILCWLCCLIIYAIFIMKENTTIIFFAFARSWKFVLLGIVMMFLTATMATIPASEVMCLVIAGTQLLPVSITEGTLILAAYTSYQRKHVQLNNWALFMIAVLIVHGLCVMMWVMMSRPEVTKTVDREDGYVYVDCVSSGNFDGVIVVVAYVIILELIGIIVSFKIRDREKHFQEGKFVFFSFIMQSMIWVTIMIIHNVLPVGEHYRTFVLSFGLVVSGLAHIGCLVVPKLYVLRFKPGINPTIKKRHLDTLWQWKFKRREDGENATRADRFGDTVRSHSARSAIMKNYRKTLAAIRDESAQALRMHNVCGDRIEDMRLRHRRKTDELAISTTSLRRSRLQCVLSTPSIEVTYC